MWEIKGPKNGSEKLGENLDELFGVYVIGHS